MNFLGLDWGKSKIGCAIGSDETMTAVPFEIIQFQDIATAILRIKKIVLENNINELVVGVPTKTKMPTKSLDIFIESLKKEIALPLHIVDERVTTKLARELIGKSKKYEDSVAAMIILQNFLDSKRLCLRQ
ncbi:Holliday junction resolvase RuvX [Candidatus Falkowbacteria bacterium]|nr:Holliday junction resolvase RuvX [Candidatus Falkowbacteria bacterium]